MINLRKSFSIYRITEKRFVIIGATWFGVGFSPFAPGTCGSFIALPFAWIIYAWTGVYGLGLATALLFFIGIWVSRRYCEFVNKHDPPEIVIDEVVGQCLTLLIASTNIFHYLLGFIIFRAFDILKPWPIYLIDKKIGGGLGVMLDDVIAGIYSAFVLVFLIAFIG